MLCGGGHLLTCADHLDQRVGFSLLIEEHTVNRHLPDVLLQHSLEGEYRPDPTEGTLPPPSNCPSFQLDYVSFARIQQSCKDVSSLVTDSPQLYSVRVVDNIVIDYHEADGKYSWVVGKHEEWSDRGTPKYCIDSALIINMTEVEKGTLETEQLAAALQGMHWRKVKLATHAHSTLSGRGTLNFASNQSEKIGGVVEALERIFKACVPKCDILTSDHSTVKVLDITKRLCNPEAVHITHHSFSFPDINIALQVVASLFSKAKLSRESNK